MTNFTRAPPARPWNVPNTKKHVSEHSWLSGWVILSILAHLAHLAQSCFSLIFSAIYTYNCAWFDRIRNFVICVSSLRGFQCKMMRQTQKKRDKRDKIRDKWDKIKDNETKDQTVSSLSFILFHSYFLIHNVSLKWLHSIWLGYTDKFITIIHID